MSRKRCHRRRVEPVPPPGLRGRFTRADLVDLAIHMHSMVETVRTGQAHSRDLWPMLRRALMWSCVAELTGIGVAEMAQQLDMTRNVVERYERTGRVGYSGDDYRIACDGVEVVTQMAESVDLVVARRASDWADAQIRVIAQLSRPGGRNDCAA